MLDITTQTDEWLVAEREAAKQSSNHHQRNANTPQDKFPGDVNISGKACALCKRHSPSEFRDGCEACVLQRCGDSESNTEYGRVIKAYEEKDFPAFIIAENAMVARLDFECARIDAEIVSREQKKMPKSAHKRGERFKGTIHPLSDHDYPPVPKGHHFAYAGERRYTTVTTKAWFTDEEMAYYGHADNSCENLMVVADEPAKKLPSCDECAHEFTSKEEKAGTPDWWQEGWWVIWATDETKYQVSKRGGNWAHGDFLENYRPATFDDLAFTANGERLWAYYNTAGKLVVAERADTVLFDDGFIKGDGPRATAILKALIGNNPIIPSAQKDYLRGQIK